MNRLEAWFLKRILKKEVQQSHSHTLRIENLYLSIRLAINAEFTEDNIPTLDQYCKECFDSSQGELEPTPTEFLWLVKEDTNRTAPEILAARTLLTMLSKQPDKGTLHGKLQ